MVKMTTSLQIGREMHKPNGDVVYPVYLRREDEVAGRTIYISAVKKTELLMEMERMFLKYDAHS